MRLLAGGQPIERGGRVSKRSEGKVVVVWPDRVRVALVILLRNGFSREKGALVHTDLHAAASDQLLFTSVYPQQVTSLLCASISCSLKWGP